MEFKVLSVLKKYMSEDEFKAFEKATDFETALQTDINKYITANTPDEKELLIKAKETAQLEVVQGLGIDTVKTIEDLKNHIEVVGNTTTDKEKALIEMTKERDSLKVNYDAEVEARTKLETSAKDTYQTNLLHTMGITDEKEIKFYKWDFNNQVTDEKDFDTVAAEYAKENGLKTTTKFVKDEFGSSGNSKDLDITDAFAKLNKRK